MTNVTLRQLRAFVTIARERSFRGAAQELNVSPSALTVAIKELEATVGLRLFDRSTRSVEVTEQAAAFLLTVERVLDDLGRALHDVHTLAKGQKGSVVVGGSASFITFVVVPAVAGLAKTHPGITVRIVEDTTENLVRRVVGGEVDLGITTLWQHLDGVESWPMLRDRVGVMCSPRYAAGLRKRNLAWSDLAHHPVVALPSGAGIRTMLDQHPDARAVLAKPAYEVSSNAALHDLVERGVAIAIVPALAARRGANGSGIFLPLRQPLIVRQLCLVRAVRRSLTPAAVELVREIFNKLRALRADEHIDTALSATISDVAGPSPRIL